jgi:hypothetical protein
VEPVPLKSGALGQPGNLATGQSGDLVIEQLGKQAAGNVETLIARLPDCLIAICVAGGGDAHDGTKGCELR